MKTTTEEFIRIYAESPKEKKIDLMFRNYWCFMGIIHNEYDSIRYKVETFWNSRRHTDCSELGVRVQNSGDYSDPTANTASNRTDLEKALISGTTVELERVLDGVEGKREYIQYSMYLRQMTTDYESLNKKINQLLREDEKRKLVLILKGERSIEDMAMEEQVQYCTMQVRLKRWKKRIKNEMINQMK